ncbi:hypothetical protein PARPLA_02299 [Rhodobacteraceae bacterium THAF1]|uniref:hypothetical protein n=1 Tax=Palleronia sp. THAF1 TaxID=2587842 RepID=UPI000F3D4A52|nr:hypothetical protein [Palleronia sp. THAF1]QFU09333.1 hypothetical protein FIU81_11675 [Palleronia sp. THAF1]VDC26779.1 hypothetical protein PARPLA_02299 [Rhodobacteraceae bacterium THAF1]
MPTELKTLSKDALRDLGSVRELGGHNDMTKDELIEGLDGPVDDDLAKWLGMTRQEVYQAAKDAGIKGAMDMDKRDLILKMADMA